MTSQEERCSLYKLLFLDPLPFFESLHHHHVQKCPLVLVRYRVCEDEPDVYLYVDACTFTEQKNSTY
jgi:hypothetical protein